MYNSPLQGLNRNRVCECSPITSIATCLTQSPFVLPALSVPCPALNDSDNMATYKPRDEKDIRLYQLIRALCIVCSLLPNGILACFCEDPISWTFPEPRSRSAQLRRTRHIPNDTGHHRQCVPQLFPHSRKPCFKWWTSCAIRTRKRLMQSLLIRQTLSTCQSDLNVFIH